MLSFKEVLLLLISLVIAIFSKNRAGLIFPGTLTLLLYARYSRIKIFILIVLIAVIAVLVIITVTPDSVLTEVDKAFSGALNPSTDQTGRWRIAIQLVALEQAFETFWLGQGYGSYFNLVVPERYQNILYEISPHNQFLVTFLKSGIIGVLLLVSLLGSYIYKSLKCVDKIPDNAHEKLFILLLLVIVSSQIFYGMTYDFIPFFGLYYGFGALLIRSIKLNTTNCVKNNNPL
jgi:O-antigen ligase